MNIADLLAVPFLRSSVSYVDLHKTEDPLGPFALRCSKFQHLCTV